MVLNKDLSQKLKQKENREAPDETAHYEPYHHDLHWFQTNWYGLQDWKD